jgi:hypothetical protein
MLHKGGFLVWHMGFRWMLIKKRQGNINSQSLTLAHHKKYFGER